MTNKIMIKVNAEKLAALNAEDARKKRDQLLSDCDWVVLRSQEQSEPVPEEWASYRRQLRDVSEQAGFPNDVIWPVSPVA